MEPLQVETLSTLTNAPVRVAWIQSVIVSFLHISVDLVMKQRVVMTEVLSHQWEYFHGQLIVAVEQQQVQETRLSWGYVKESHDVESWDNLDGAHKVRLCLRDFGQELVP